MENLDDRRMTVYYQIDRATTVIRVARQPGGPMSARVTAMNGAAA